MCGIYGYIGAQQAKEILLQGLHKLEYRGYDSAGMIIGSDDSQPSLRKAIGEVNNLGKEVHADNIEGTYGIAHTRRATHGGVSLENCHPHVSNDHQRHIVHNGIIENYMKLKIFLQDQGYSFSSQTDTEVIVNLLEYERTGDILETVQHTLKKLRGAYALLITHRDHPNAIIATRMGSPLLLAFSDEGLHFSSDQQALPGSARQLIFLEEGDVVFADNTGYRIYSGSQPIMRDIELLDQTMLEQAKGEHKHRMIKEITEQPAIIRRLLKGRVDLATSTLTAHAFDYIKQHHYDYRTFVGCGTSYHSALLACYWFDERCSSRLSVMIASEYKYHSLKNIDQTLHLFTSQSGETADSIACLKQIKSHGGASFGIVNVPGSTLARQTDVGMFTRCGAEISVASTKAFTAQALNLYLLHLALAQKEGSLSHRLLQEKLTTLTQLPNHMETIISQSEHIRAVAHYLTGYDHIFFLGRHYQLPIAYEIALKLKEIAYIHTEAYPAGELKHGPLALIDEKFLSILLMPDDGFLDSNRSTLHEIQARGGKVLVISDTPIPEADRQITIPSIDVELIPLLTNVVGQLLAYHTADILGLPIDKPRNLAKSVTVE